MPVSLLTLAQRERYGRYPNTLSTIELARYFYLDDDDLEWINLKRRDFTRLGYALQLTTVRFLGTFVEDVNALTRPPNDVFYLELQKKQATVNRFLPKLLRTIQFDGNPAGKPLLQAFEWLRHRPDHDPPADIINKAWQRHVKQENGDTDPAAFAFCALETCLGTRYISRQTR